MSEKSNAWRNQEAKRENEALKEILANASPDTVAKIEQEVANKIAGNNASLDKSLDKPDPEKK